MKLWAISATATHMQKGVVKHELTFIRADTEESAKTKAEIGIIAKYPFSEGYEGHGSLAVMVPRPTLWQWLFE